MFSTRAKRKGAKMKITLGDHPAELTVEEKRIRVSYTHPISGDLEEAVIFIGSKDPTGLGGQHIMTVISNPYTRQEK